MADDIATIVRDFLAQERSPAQLVGPSRGGALVIEHGRLTHFLGQKVLAARQGQVAPGARRLWLERMLVALRPVPALPRADLLPGRLLPRLRATLAVEQQRTERVIVERVHGLSAPDMLLASRPWVGGLSTLLAFEMAEEAVDVAELHLKNWGVDFDRGLALALEGLKQRSSSKPLEVASGLYASTAADGFDAARLLLPELWEGLQVRGKKVAMVPHQDALFIAGSDDDDALSHLASLALDLGQQPLGISAQTFALEGGAWVPWTPDPARPCAALLENARLPERARGYERQKALLEAQAELDHVADEISSFVILRDDDQQLVSAAVWLEGTEPLLPRAERIAFAIRPKEAPAEGEPSLRAFAIPWDEAVAIAGVKLEPTSHQPERFRARGFPPLSVLEGE